MANSSAYSERANKESEFFRKQEGKFNKLPPMMHWMAERYLKPRVTEIFGTSGPVEFYAKPILDKMSSQKTRVLITSIGSGDGEVELGLGKFLSDRGTNYLIEGYELSADLVRICEAKSSEMGLAENVKFVPADFNSWDFEKPFDFCIANQVLHHAVELEALFDKIQKALAHDGIFMTRDVIGKNGHQAWPEAKAMIDAIWQFMPERYKYNHRLEKSFSEFPNTDFSTEGFEGIRAQDIMPLMVENFHFSHFYAFGGIVERFVNRGFGHCYDTNSSEDKDFCIGLQAVNDFTIDSGIITPTQIVAYAGKRYLKDVRCWKNRTPMNAIRKSPDLNT